MAAITTISPAHCTLLAAHYATESNIDSLRALTLARPDAFKPEQILRILLTYLPETLEPSVYSTYALEAATSLYLEQRDEPALDLSFVSELTNAQASRRAQKLRLLPLVHHSCPAGQSLDLLTAFLIHRSYQIDTQTRLLDLVPSLVVPFLDRSEFLKTWFISIVLPLLRLQYEYYPNHTTLPTLESFEKLHGLVAIDTLLVYPQHEGHLNIGRDIRGVVGPWMYAYAGSSRHDSTEGKDRRPSVSAKALEADGSAEASLRDDRAKHDWDSLFKWLVLRAVNDFTLVAAAVEAWDGPGDVDLGGYADARHHLTEEVQEKLKQRYAQAAFASIYAVNDNSAAAVENAHSILVRLADLLDFEPPPDLATSIELLPRIDSHSSVLQGTSTAVLRPEALLQAGHPLTTPKLETFSLLQRFVYSTYLLSSLHHPISVASAAKLRFQSDEEEQLQLVQKVLHGLVHGPKMDELQWALVQRRLLWLWNWGMDSDDDLAEQGPGVLGKIGRSQLATEIAKAFIASGCYSLAIDILFKNSPERQRLSKHDAEKVVLSAILHNYDNASNGNKTRGGMKKASDILTAFEPYFGSSPSFVQCKALLAATHSLSFYSLKLQHGVPFQPVNIRVSTDPISLLKRVLDQNPGSYAHLDDLIGVGRNLVVAGAVELNKRLEDEPIVEIPPSDLDQRKDAAERRVIGMAIEAALNEDDFETAYSYVVNRLHPSSLPGHHQEHSSTAPGTSDDVLWRAAFSAGRHGTSSASSKTHTSSTDVKALRRLEQRMELLSQALLLAPPEALPEILAVWQDCEHELNTMLAHEQAEEDRFDAHLDRRMPGEIEPVLRPQQPRRAPARGAMEETPMGLFDVARGAAAAFSRSAFPLRGEATHIGAEPGHARTRSGADGHDEHLDSVHDHEGRPRKRDLVASAVTGGLASGIGWVLGATPVPNQPRT